MQLQLRNFNSATYKTIYKENYSIGKVQSESYIFYTFDGQQLINLYNGTALEINSRSVVSILGIFDQIRNVRNREGYIIAKRKTPFSPLKKVRFVKRK